MRSLVLVIGSRDKEKEEKEKNLQIAFICRSYANFVFIIIIDVPRG